MAVAIEHREEFGGLAENYSIDKESASHKGDVGYFTYQTLPEPIRDDVLKMKIDKVSKPYKRAGKYTKSLTDGPFHALWTMPKTASACRYSTINSIRNWRPSWTVQRKPQQSS